MYYIVLLNINQVKFVSQETLPEELFTDLVLLNGKIVTIDDHDSVVEAVACRGEKIVKVGSDNEVKAFIGNNTKVIDLEGKTVTPGFIDTHFHLRDGVIRLPRQVDLRYVRSMDARARNKI